MGTLRTSFRKERAFLCSISRAFEFRLPLPSKLASGYRRRGSRARGEADRCRVPTKGLKQGLGRFVHVYINPRALFRPRERFIFHARTACDFLRGILRSPRRTPT